MSFNYEIRNGTIVTPERATRPRAHSSDDSWLAPEDYDDLLETNSTGTSNDESDNEVSSTIPPPLNVTDGWTRKLSPEEIKKYQNRRSRRNRSSVPPRRCLSDGSSDLTTFNNNNKTGGGCINQSLKGLSQYKSKCMQSRKDRDAFQRQASQSMAKYGYFV